MEVFPHPISVDFSNLRGSHVAEEVPDTAESASLAGRLETELRAAKSAQLACGEVLLPSHLLPRIARNLLKMAENEPCGIRGCKIFIHFEGPEIHREISKFKCDPQTVSTFELHLTLKQDAASWHSKLPQFLKNLTRGGSLVISPAFTVQKNKLYRSNKKH